MEHITEVMAGMGVHLDHDAVSRVEKTEENISGMLNRIEAKAAGARRAIAQGDTPEALEERLDALAAEVITLKAQIVTEYRYREEARGRVREGLRG